MKIGDKVVCIDNSDSIVLVKYGVYTIQSYNDSGDDIESINGYFAYRFITLGEYRKRKLKKLNCVHNEDR